MNHINPIISNQWLEDNRKHLCIPLADSKSLKKIQELVYSKDWEETRINGEAYI
ncbi:hypothetical protein [Streptococcus thoraltensis]|uniref:hypothetical protein n=1 Tax=Streptococcus thoraltensis TaxID=55085 RepID=UPI001F57F6CB|nr:hypothetical protein [Streptococcus thoraltensis]